jgi:ABC-2 type transport system permease protein
MLVRIANVVWKEMIQFARDRVLTAFLFLLPILQLALLARATGGRIGGMRVAVLDFDHSAVTREMVSSLNAREELTVSHFVQDENQLQRLLDRGAVRVGIIFPRGLAEELPDPARAPQVAIMVDGSNSIAGSTALGAARAALSETGRRLASARDGQLASPIDLRVVTYYNPTHNLRHFSIPAQVGFITYQITLSVASLGLARERELGTLEQLIVAPLGRLELVLGKAIPALVIGTLNFLLMLAVAVTLFQVPLRGSLALLLGLTLLFILAEIGWGMMISAVARTQQQAILFVFILAMVDISLSGFMVPVQNLPIFLRLASRLAPMYHYLVVIRAVMLKGAGLPTLWLHALALGGLGCAVLTIAVLGVSRRLD